MNGFNGHLAHLDSIPNGGTSVNSQAEFIKTSLEWITKEIAKCKQDDSSLRLKFHNLNKIVGELRHDMETRTLPYMDSDSSLGGNSRSSLGTTIQQYTESPWMRRRSRASPSPTPQTQEQPQPSARPDALASASMQPPKLSPLVERRKSPKQSPPTQTRPPEQKEQEVRSSKNSPSIPLHPFKSSPSIQQRPSKSPSIEPRPRSSVEPHSSVSPSIGPRSSNSPSIETRPFKHSPSIETRPFKPSPSIETRPFKPSPSIETRPFKASPSIESKQPKESPITHVKTPKMSPPTQKRPFEESPPTESRVIGPNRQSPYVPQRKAPVAPVKYSGPHPQTGLKESPQGTSSGHTNERPSDKKVQDPSGSDTPPLDVSSLSISLDLKIGGETFADDLFAALKSKGLDL